MKIYLKKLQPEAQAPKQGSQFAGGWDVVATRIEQPSPDVVICYLGFALQLPSVCRLRISPRSSFTKSTWIMQNTPGLCDADYFGEYQIRFRAIPTGVDIESNKLLYDEFPYKVGERVGQCYLEYVVPTDFEVVDELVQIGDRGEGGYGSTGNSVLGSGSSIPPTWKKI